MRIKTKFVIITLLSSLVLAGIINIFYIYKTKEYFYTEFRNKSILSARNFTTLTKEALNNEDDILLFSYVDNMKKEENVIYSGIVDNNKNVIAHSDCKELDKTYTDEEGILYKDAILKINNPITTNSGEKYLSICGFSTEILKSDLNNLCTQAAVISIIALFIPILVLTFFTNKLQQNLNIIQDSIQLANEGVYKQEINMERREIEILNIAKNLSRLYEKIKIDSVGGGIIDPGIKKDAIFEAEIIKDMVNSMSDGIIVTNPRNSVLLHNNSSMKILKQDNIGGKHILEICKDNKELLGLFNESIKNKNESVKSKITLNEKEYSVTIKTITKSEKETLGSIIVFRDSTQLRWVPDSGTIPLTP